MSDYSQLVQDVHDGRENPLKAYAILKSQAQHIKTCLTEIDGAVFDELDRHSENTFEFNGYEFQYRRGGAIYKFDHIPEWEAVKKELKAIENRYRIALKAKEDNLLAITEDGEELVLPKITYKKDSLLVQPMKH